MSKWGKKILVMHLESQFEADQLLVWSSYTMCRLKILFLPAVQHASLQRHFSELKGVSFLPWMVMFFQWSSQHLNPAFSPLSPSFLCLLCTGGCVEACVHVEILHLNISLAHGKHFTLMSKQNAPHCTKHTILRCKLLLNLMRKEHFSDFFLLKVVVFMLSDWIPEKCANGWGHKKG